MPTPSELAKKRESLRKDFINNFCNDHNRSIRWLRGAFFDEKEKLDTILAYLEKADSRLQESSTLLLENVAEMAEGMKVKEIPIEEIERLKNANHFEQKIEMYKMGRNQALSDLSLKLREEAKIIRGDK